VIRGRSHEAADAPGAEAAVSFSGTGVALWAIMSPRGGKIDVFLDEERPRVANAWEDEHTHDEVPFHVMNLAPGAHRLRLVVRDDSDPRSEGHELVIRGAVVYDRRSREGASRNEPLLMR
jgi:hypothetical protein